MEDRAEEESVVPLIIDLKRELEVVDHHMDVLDNDDEDEDFLDDLDDDEEDEHRLMIDDQSQHVPQVSNLSQDDQVSMVWNFFLCHGCLDKKKSRCLSCC